MGDRYADFASLAAENKEGIDYRVRCTNRRSSIVLVAPHGGSIEPGSSQIADAIARDDYSVYCFDALRPHRGKPHDLHITSVRFNEPMALELIGASAIAVAVHGRGNRGDPQTVWMGGLDETLGDAIAASLRAAGFSTAAAKGKLSGRTAANICNRGTTGAGVQLEIPRELRDRLVRNPLQLQAFSDAVREALAVR